MRMKTIVGAEKNEVTLNTGRRFYVILFVVAVAIIVLRRPDAFLNPQFWAEDGKIFYQDAYNRGILTALFLPYAGYLDGFGRLIASFSQLFPLSWAPLLFNLSVVLIRLLTVGLIVSPRFFGLVPDLRVRLFLSFLFLALPNSWEANAGLATIKFHLAFLAFLVLSAKCSDKPLDLIFAGGIILMSGLSGPSCILLTPIATLVWLIRRDKRSLVLFVLVGVCAIIQGMIFMISSARPQRILGATPELFVKILSTQIFLGALIGQKGLALIYNTGLYDVLAIVFAIAGLAALINASLKAPLELRLFILYAFLLFGAALYSPLVNKTMPQWPLLLIPGVGGRYWFTPMLAFVGVLVWSLRGSASRVSKTLAASALIIMLAGIILDWREPAFKDLNFMEHVRRFESSASGTQVTIPINPPGWSKSMVLTKH
jgi:hypothetical protein